MRVAEGGLRSGVDLGIGVLVLVLAAAVALTPSVLGAGFPSRGPARVSSDAVVPAGVATFNPPHFDSGYDANGNGLFDFLLVNVSLSVTVAGNFTVAGTLHDPGYILYLNNATSAFLPVGPAIVTVWFQGGAIYASGVDGPYTVDLLLLNETYSIIDTGSHTTQAYSHLAFDPPPAFMTPPHPDSGEDTNGNGLFDFLNVDVHVQVNVAGNYTVSGFLHNANYSLTVFNTAAAALTVGPASIRVPFSGPLINESGIDGPYIVELQLFAVDGTPVSLGSNTTTTQAYNHLAFDGAPPVPPIQSSPATTIPMIDGTISSGEWDDATRVNLTAIAGNTLPAYLLVKNNATMLYMAYDAVGDTTMTADDAASLAFDTGNDGVGSNGHEDQFVQGGIGGNPSNQSHWVFNSASGLWSLEDAPYNPNLPNHAGLASAWGFGASPALGADHRMYDFAIPLALLVSGPNQTLGFFGGSQQSPGVVDFATFQYSLWPKFAGGPIPLAEYGDLILAGAGGGDTTPPTISINTPAPGQLFPVGSVPVNWSASDVGTGLDHFELRVDLGTPVVLGPDVTGYTVSLADGNHTIQVTAFDGANNSASASVPVIVDTTSPSLSVTYPADGAVFATTTVAMAWTASDATSGLDRLELSLDGGPATVLAPNETNHTFAGLSDGSHTATLVAYDRAGHSTTAARTFVVDTTAPTVTIDAPVAGWVSTRSVQVTWTAADVGSGLDHIEVSLDGNPPAVLPGTATSTTLTGVSDGPHTIVVQAFDRAGSSASASVAISVDATLPTATVTSPTPGQFLGTSSVQLTWTASDAPSGIDHFEVSIDGGVATTVPSGTTTYVFTGVTDGSHTFRLRAIDRAGNAVTASVTATVDVSPPTLAISSPTAAAFIRSHSVIVTWTAGDATSGIDHYLVSLDGGSAQTVVGTATSYTFAGTSDGAHTILVTAVDRAGNTHPASVTVTVDATNPSVSIVGPAAGAVISAASATVTWTASDAASGIDHIEIRVDGGAAQTLSADATSQTLSGLSDGTHTVNVTVVDRAGNAVSSTVSFRTDTSILSPSGPLGIFGPTSIILLVVAAIIAAILIVRRRRRPKAP
ncbi:MAG: hypothetical protein E6J98_02340 [Methanobacteriota archaeon]|nr:MAG: hypothetical protein E6J98_02340 [Euryarchaeota archaeon]